MQLDRPVIIVGVGRSGSTMLHDVLALHPQFVWLSNVSNRFPTRLRLSRWAVSLRHVPFVRGLPWRPKPDEAYGFWEHYSKGFGAPFRDLTADDLTLRAKQNVTAALAKLSYRPSQRLLLKVTGWPRLGFLDALLPEARFIHVVRDGRAVANSLLQVPFWRGWAGPHGWRYGALPADLEQVWLRHDRSFVALAGIQWILQMRAMDAARRCIPDERFLQVRYEDVCARGKSAVQAILDYAGVPSCRTFQRRLARFDLRTQNHKWTVDLTEQQQAVLDDVLAEALLHYGYQHDHRGRRRGRAA